MTPPTPQEIERALQLLTWNYGRGDFVRIVDETHFTYRIPLTQRTFSDETQKTYSVTGRTVRAWGHRLTIPLKS